ncbi:MAG: DUF4340 domain-containing protein [Limnochordales bacterium]|nr:DUF4340 domain-containing protein [Limnochordales bacterium]
MTSRLSRPSESRQHRKRRQRWLTTGVVLLVFAVLAVYAWMGRQTNRSGSPGSEGEGVLPPLWQADVEDVREIRVEYPREPERESLVVVRGGEDSEDGGGAAGTAAAKPVAYAPVPRFRSTAAVPFATYRPPVRKVEWMLRSPLHAPADANTLDRVAQMLARPVPEAEVRPAEDLAGDEQSQRSILAAYGLDTPRAVVRVRFGSSQDGSGDRTVEKEIRIGDPTPITYGTDTPSGYYVYSPAHPGVFTLSAYDVEPLLQEAVSLRDLQVNEWEASRVYRLRILWDAGEGKAAASGSAERRLVAIEAEKSSGLSAAGNPETRWQLLSPRNLPADSARIQAILADLANLRAESVVDGGSLGEYGLTNPRGEIIVWLDEEGSQEQPAPAGKSAGDSQNEAIPLARVLHIGATSPDGNVVYVRAADDDTVYAVESWRLASVQEGGDNWLGLVTRLVLPSAWGWGQDLGRRLQEIAWTSGGRQYRLVGQAGESWQLLADGRPKQLFKVEDQKLTRIWNALSSLRLESVTRLGAPEAEDRTPSTASDAGQLERVRLLPRPAGARDAGTSSGSESPVEIVLLPVAPGEADALSISLQVTGEGFTRQGKMARSTWQELADSLAALLPRGQE